MVFTDENIKAVENDDQGEVDECKPGSVGLEGGFEDECVAIYALSDESFVELDIGNTYTTPGE